GEGPAAGGKKLMWGVGGRGRGTRPTDARMATKMPTSASAMTVGPDTVPPGRLASGPTCCRRRAPPYHMSATVRPLSGLKASGKSRARRRSSSSADSTGARINPPVWNLLPGCLMHRVQCFEPAHQEARVTVSPARKPMTDAPPILLREDLGDIAVVTLNRPEARNSLSLALLTALG